MGKADLTISDYYDIYVLFNTGNFTFKTAKVADAADGIFAAPADVNQDGTTDLLVSYYTCSTDNELVVNSPSSSLNEPLSL
jgi:hypothetical protein